jgi:hypothetical protein
MAIKQCECGSKEFIIHEKIENFAEIDEDGNLGCYNQEAGGIMGIECAECGKEYSSDLFNEIIF